MIDVHIDELVLIGIPARDREAVAEALHRELMQLVPQLRLEDAAPGDRRIDRLNMGAFRIGGKSGAGALANGIASAVGEAIARSTRTGGER